MPQGKRGGSSGAKQPPKQGLSKPSLAKPTFGAGFDVNGVKALAELMDAHDLVELEVSETGIRLCKRRAEALAMPVAMPAMSAAADNAGAENSSPTASDAKSAGKKGERPPDVVEFVSPMVGTFYRAPNPEAKAYVVEGDKVDENSVLCIIEAMKVMNEIKSEIRGQVVDILVENGEAVEFGQPLFLIKKT